MSRYAEAVIAADLCRKRGKAISFKTGCFDIFHIGHLRALEFAAEYGALFVGVGSDETVRALKGDGRPFFDEITRSGVIAGLKCVEHSFVLSEPCVGRIDHEEALKEIRPDFWMLPPTDKALNEKRTLAKALGIRVLMKAEMPECSSSSLERFIRSGYGG